MRKSAYRFNMGRKSKYNWGKLLDAKEGEWINFGKGDRNSMQICARTWLQRRMVSWSVVSMYDDENNVLIAIFAW